MKDIEIDQRNGFTLVEMLVSMLLFGLISLVIVQFILGSAKFYESIINGEEIRNNLYLASRRFSTDVASLRDYQHIESANSMLFRFIDSNLNTIQYRYSDGNLYREKNSEGEFPIAQYLTNDTQFMYFNSNEDILDPDVDFIGDSNFTNFWTIRLQIVAEKGTRSMKIQSMIFPQNLKYGVVR